MVQAYLLSYVLQQYFIRRAAFGAKYPHPWLVWEPGHWTSPPYDESTVVPKQKPGAPFDVAAAMAHGNALCFELKPPPAGTSIKVGRAPGNDLVISDGTVSREHLILKHDPQASRWSMSSPVLKTTTHRRRPALPGEMLLSDRDAIGMGEITLTFHDPPGFLQRLEQEVAKQVGPKAPTG